MTITETATERVGVASDLIVGQNVTAGYREKIVWKDASFSFGRGEFVAIIGSNGAGKTTLMRMLLGLQPALSGTLKILGAEPKRGNTRIGYVPQRHTIHSDTNVESQELVRLGLSGKRWGANPFSHWDRDAATKALGLVGATEIAHRPLGFLPGGELQRVFLAEALVSNLHVLLLDEPLSQN